VIQRATDRALADRGADFQQSEQSAGQALQRNRRRLVGPVLSPAGRLIPCYRLHYRGGGSAATPPSEVLGRDGADDVVAALAGFRFEPRCLTWSEPQAERITER
jgi:hypothetical protein